MKHDTSHAERVARITFFNIWIVIGVIIIASVALNLIGSLSSVLLFLSVGCLSAFVASPIVNWLERHRVPRGAGALIGLIVVMVGLILLFALVIPMVTGQLIDLLRDAPSKFSALGAWVVRMESKYAVVEHLNDIVQLDSIFTAAQDIVNQALSGLLAAVRDGIVPMVNNIASTVFIVFLGFVLAFWLACDYPRINEEICRVLPEGKADDYRLMVAVVSRSVGGYLRSTVINSVIQGFLAFVGFAIVGHPYAGAMGVLSGVLNIIPVVGPSISAALASLIALVYSPIMALWTMVMAMLSQNITDNVIAPKINQSTMQVHPVLSLTALVVGSTFGGAAGMIVALPLVAVIKSLFIFYFETRTGEQIVSYEGALFRGAPFRDAQGNPVPAFDALGDDSFVADSQIIDESSVPEAEAMPKPELENPWAKLIDFENPFTSHEHDVGAKKPEETDTTDDGR
ncbi:MULTISPECIES: AI-2E family transporter [unclassified Collinsella]|uniref:AI-2E family transporter n=1 Tax=unclassified Collinsella TaxID=2637548 RepID=UPI000E531CD9|nr:AI-2E family transporter [Collinsella sp. AF08-23]RHS40021.1 AI-2E family transporter [Collinsella sp. AF08-23]